MSKSHGGILLPFDLYRVSLLAAALAEGLVSRARNINDAKLVVTRHPSFQVLLLGIQGSVIGTDAAAFWREYADLAILISQLAPRQVFLYYAEPGPLPPRREGFLVAQRGQVLAADDAQADALPADATEEDWPVARLCAQMGLSLAELAGGFAGGPRVEVPLAEPRTDDQAALNVLAGRGAPGTTDAGAAPVGGPGTPSAATAGAATPTGASPGGSAAATGRAARPDEAREDARRRAAAQTAEDEQARARAASVREGLPQIRDALGVVVAPRAELAEADLLRAFVVSRVEGELPEGISRELTRSLQGQRIDVVVPVEFASEVFLDNKPLTRAAFEERGTAAPLAGAAARRLEVLAPRVGRGTLWCVDRRFAFVSRGPEDELPEEFVLAVIRG
jgi:hypothetical protein